MFRQWCFFVFFFFRNRLWLVHHHNTHTHTHTTMLLFFLFFAYTYDDEPNQNQNPHQTFPTTTKNTAHKHCTYIYIYVYTHTQTKTTQVPNPEAFVLLGEIGYVFRFDNIFFSFFATGRRRLRLRPPSLFRKNVTKNHRDRCYEHNKHMDKNKNSNAKQHETTRNNNTP